METQEIGLKESVLDQETNVKDLECRAKMIQEIHGTMQNFSENNECYYWMGQEDGNFEILEHFKKEDPLQLLNLQQDFETLKDVRINFHQNGNTTMNYFNSNLKNSKESLFYLASGKVDSSYMYVEIPWEMLSVEMDEKNVTLQSLITKKVISNRDFATNVEYKIYPKTASKVGKPEIHIASKLNLNDDIESFYMDVVFPNGRSYQLRIRPEEDSKTYFKYYSKKGMGTKVNLAIDEMLLKFKDNKTISELETIVNVVLQYIDRQMRKEKIGSLEIPEDFSIADILSSSMEEKVLQMLSEIEDTMYVPNIREKIELCKNQLTKKLQLEEQPKRKRM